MLKSSIGGNSEGANTPAGVNLQKPIGESDIFSNFSSDHISLQEKERIFWDIQRREKIDVLLANALLEMLINIKIPSKIKRALEKFCSMDAQNLSYDLLKSIGFTRIVKNRGHIESMQNNVKSTIPSIEITSNVRLHEVKELVSLLLTRQLTGERKTKLMQRIIKNEFPFAVVDLGVTAMIASKELPKAIQDEYNVMNISGLSAEEYKEAKKIGFSLYWENYCKKISEQESRLNKEKFKDIVMVVITMYKNTPPYRKELAIDFFERLQTLGIACIVGDGGSDQDFLDRLSTFPNVVIKHLDGKSDKPYGMPFGNDKRAALAEALKIFPEDEPGKIFIQTEPEKKRFANPLNLNLIVDAMKDKSIVLANRKDMISMPRLQAAEEKKAAEKIANMMGYQGKLDFFQSATICTKDGAQYFLDYEPFEKESYEGAMVTFIHAYQYGLQVGTAEVDAVYSRKEKVYEQRGSGRNVFTKKRIFSQYVDLVPKIEHQIKYTDLCLALQKDFPKDFSTIKVTVEIVKGASLLNTTCIFLLHVGGENTQLKKKLEVRGKQKKIELGGNYDVLVN